MARMTMRFQLKVSNKEKRQTLFVSCMHSWTYPRAGPGPAHVRFLSYHHLLPLEALHRQTWPVSWRINQPSVDVFAFQLIIFSGYSSHSLFRCAFLGRNLSIQRSWWSGQEWVSAAGVPDSPPKRGEWNGGWPSTSDDGQLCEYLLIFTAFSLLPRWSPRKPKCVSIVPSFFQSPLFLHFRPKNASKVSAATI